MTTSEAGATGLTVNSGNVPFPYFGAAGRPEHNHTLGQPLPPKSGFLSLSGKFWTGNELPVGLTHVFSTSEEIKLMLVPCDTTTEQMEHARLYRFHEAEVVITKRDAGLGERTMALQSDVGFDYEIV